MIRFAIPRDYQYPSNFDSPFVFDSIYPRDWIMSPAPNLMLVFTIRMRFKNQIVNFVLGCFVVVGWPKKNKNSKMSHVYIMRSSEMLSQLEFAPPDCSLLKLTSLSLSLS